MSYTDIIYTKEEHVATITINRPDRHNALRFQTLEEMAAALEIASDDSEVGVTVITGSGERAFCVGGDLSDIDEAGQKISLERLNRQLLKIAVLIRNMPKPVIASVNGLCIGGGNELNAFCDLTIASEMAVFGHVEPKIGTAPLWGGTQLLPRILGEKKAREMVFFCHRYSAHEAERIGLVNKVVPKDTLSQETKAWCEELLAKSPQALRMCKLSLNFDTDQLWPSLNHGLALIGQLWQSEELEEGRNSFKQNRKPDFNRFRR